MVIASAFREILNTYNEQKSKTFQDNPLVFKIRNHIPEDISKIMGDNFTVKAACGVNSWSSSPWISIFHNRFNSSFNALLIQYNFDIENKCVSLSLVSKLNDDNIEKYFDFDDNNAFLFKTYGLDQITDNILINDLKELTLLYNELYDFITQNEEKITTPLNYGVENKYQRSITIDKFFTKETLDRIMACNIAYKDYANIIEDIKINAQKRFDYIIKSNSIDFNRFDLKKKILIISKSFVETDYKSVGGLLGSYSFNQILVDDRLPSPLLITSIIHELSHFLLEKILKEVLMKLLNTNDNPLISSYIKITLENDLNYLFDEFQAHCVEGRFSLYGYQDYSSFELKLNEISDKYSTHDIEYALIIGNTFAFDIKGILEEFIDADLREEIKNEFLKLRDFPNYNPLSLEIGSKLIDMNFIYALNIVLSAGFSEALEDSEKLERYMKKYENFF